MVRRSRRTFNSFRRICFGYCFFFSSRRRHTRFDCDWSSDVCSSDLPRSGLFSSAMAFVAGFSVVFIAFGASASAVGAFLKQNRNLLAPVAGALILLFGLHLIGALVKLKLRVGIILGVILAALGVAADRKSTRLNSSHSQISYAVF